MCVKQLWVVIKNQPGKIEKVVQLLGDANINLLALCVADAAKEGFLRLLVDNNDLANKVLYDYKKVLHDYGENLEFGFNPVTAVKIDNGPGSLARILALLRGSKVNLEYMYTMGEPKVSTKPIMIFRFNDTDTDTALNILEKNGIHVLTEDELLNPNKQ